MKNAKLLLVALVFAGTIVTSCKKDDKDVSSPNVTLNGDQVVTIDLHGSYVEQGATANDDKDGSLTSGVVTSGSPDVNKAGVYTVNYSVTDNAGNTGENSRKVIVRHTTSTIAGTYAVKDSCGSSSTSYVEIVTMGNTTKLNVTRFANYDNATVSFDISGETNSTITVAEQSVFSGTPPATRKFKGTGSVSADGKKFTISYTETTNNTTTSCTGVYTRP